MKTDFFAKKSRVSDLALLTLDSASARVGAEPNEVLDRIICSKCVVEPVASM
jgi:hypothetical protein